MEFKEIFGKTYGAYMFSGKKYAIDGEDFGSKCFDSLPNCDSFMQAIGAVARATGTNLYKANAFVSLFEKMNQKRLNFLYDRHGACLVKYINKAGKIVKLLGTSTDIFVDGNEEDIDSPAVLLSPIFFNFLEDDYAPYYSRGNMGLGEALVGLCTAFYFYCSQYRKNDNITISYNVSLTLKGFKKQEFFSDDGHSCLAGCSVEELLDSEKEEKKKSSSWNLKKIRPLKAKAVKGRFEGLTEEDKKLIPKLSSDFVITNTFKRISTMFAKRWLNISKNMDAKKEVSEIVGTNNNSFLLYGTPGTGKTTLVRNLAAAFKLPYHVVTLMSDSDSSDFQGKYIVKDGKLDMFETEFLRAAAKPGVLVLEDFNIAPPEIINALLSFLEAPYVYTRNGVETLTRHPLCFVFLTMNPECQGTAVQNQAILSRLDKFEMNMPSEEEMVEVLTKTTKDRSVCEAVYKLFKKLHEMVSNQDSDLAQNLTMRACLQMLTRLNEGESFAEASDALTTCVSVADEEAGADLATLIKSDSSTIAPFNWNDRIVESDEDFLFKTNDEEEETSEVEVKKEVEVEAPKKKGRPKKAAKKEETEGQLSFDIEF